MLYCTRNRTWTQARHTHPKAQGQVEVFTEMVKKTISIAIQDYIDPHEVTYEMVQAYRSNPHPATGMTPCRPLMNLDIRSKLDHFPAEIHSQDQLVWMHDGLYIQKHEDYLDKCIMQDCTHWKLRTKSEVSKKAKSLMNHTVLCKSNADEIRRISFFVLANFRAQFRVKFCKILGKKFHWQTIFRAKFQGNYQKWLYKVITR